MPVRGVSLDRLRDGLSTRRPLQIAIIRQRYAQDGGAERFVARLMDALSRDAVQPTLIARDWREADGFKAIRVNPFFVGRLWRDWSFARAVCRLLRRHRFDLVQSHERIACCDVYRAGDGLHREWLAQRAQVLRPLGQLAMRLNPYHRYVLHAEARLFRSANLRAVICNSHMVKAEIERHFNLSPERLRVIYSGVDLSVYHPDVRRHWKDVRAREGINTAAPVFLFVGSGFERKGLAATLAALARVPSAHLLVVGRDKRVSQFRRHAERLGVAARAHFLGEQADVKPYYGAAEALVLPSLYDPFPNVALEAMACGLPVVTSRKSGAAEVIDEGMNGFVRDSLDINGIADALRALADPERRAAMSAAARARVEAFDIAHMSRELLALYRDLVHADAG